MKSTNWGQAQTNIEAAILGLLSCLESGKNAWIEAQTNGDQTFPIMIPNPVLDDPFNWTMMYGVPRNKKMMEEHRYINETERDLTYNWVAAFSDRVAADLYRTTGEVIKGLFASAGVCTPVRVADANKYRAEVVGDNYQYGSWVTFWTPKEGIPYRVPAPIGKVFVVCYNDDPAPDKATVYAKLAEVLLQMASANKEQGSEICYSVRDDLLFCQ